MATLIVLFLLLNLLYFPSFFCADLLFPGPRSKRYLSYSSSRHPSHADRPLLVEEPLTSLRICSQPLPPTLPFNHLRIVSYRANKHYYLP